MDLIQLKDKLEKLAARKCWYDDETFEVYGVSDFAGGNQDDAYHGGKADGEAILAREILKELEYLDR